MEADAEDETCCICLERLPWCGFWDLPCGHTGCVRCLTQWTHATLTSYGGRRDFSCPVCRAPIHQRVQVIDPALRLPGIRCTDPASRTLHCVVDTFANWFVVAVETDRGFFLPQPPPRSTRAAYKHSMTVWLNPYAGSSQTVCRPTYQRCARPRCCDPPPAPLDPVDNSCRPLRQFKCIANFPFPILFNSSPFYLSFLPSFLLSFLPSFFPFFFPSFTYLPRCFIFCSA